MTDKKSRKAICRDVLTLPLCDYNLDDLLEKLNECKEQHPYNNLSVGYYGEDMAYHGPDSMCIYYYSEETDDEYQLRILYEEELIKEKELKEMKRLQSYKKLNPANQTKLDMYLVKYKDYNNE